MMRFVYRSWESSEDGMMDSVSWLALRYQPPDQRFTRGWVKQQLVKLACASIIQTPFYQILDADIFAVHPFSARDLFQEGPCEASSAVCDTATATSFRSKNDCYRMEGEWHASWYAAQHCKCPCLPSSNHDSLDVCPCRSNAIPTPTALISFLHFMKH